MYRFFSKILISLFASVAFTSIGFTSDLPFVDVSPTDDYYEDLVNLYERGIIPDSPNKRFNPDSLMNRDDFVSIVVGVGCKKCLMPSFDDILKYRDIPFIDFKRENQNFYCVSYAKEQGIVEGYVVDSSGKSACEDGQVYTEAPFCAYNKITRIEAAAVLLRQGGLWNNILNSQSFERRLTIPDTSEYWYGYAQKAVDVGIITPDATGKIRPNENITRREFIRMAANIFRVNLCAIRSDANTDGVQMTQLPTIVNSGDPTPASGFSSEIRILDSGIACSKDAPVTRFPDPRDTSYTFFGRSTTMSGSFAYDWTFTRASDGLRITGTGACLENFDLKQGGTWNVGLTITNEDTKAVSQSSATLSIVDSLSQASTPSLSTQASALEAAISTSVQFGSTLTGGVGPFSYVWNFDDGTTSTEVNPSHIFDTPGVRNIKLTVTDSNGKVAQATTVIVLKDSASSNSTTPTTSTSKLPTETPTSTSQSTASGVSIGVSSEIRILDSEKDCSNATSVTTFPNPKDTSYTFFGRTNTAGGPYEYAWDFARVQDGASLTATGKCLKNFDLKSDGTWLVRLTVKDTSTNLFSQSLSTVEVLSGASKTPTEFKGLSLGIQASALNDIAPSNIRFRSTLSGAVGPVTYRWDFADGSFSSEENPTHNFETSGVREVLLTVRDSRGAVATASVVLVFTESDDWDKDTLTNDIDLCPLVSGTSKNRGCPSVATYNGDTPASSATSAYVPGLSLTLAGVNGQCRLSYAAGPGAIFGLPTCTSCPCQYTADFNATLRSCDVIFPSIMSPDKATVYSRGKVFEIRF